MASIASQPPPTSWRVQFGDSPWLELAADASTLEMTSTAFLQLLLADPLLGPAAKSLQPPLALWHLVVIQRILSDSRRTPTKDDDVDDNVAVITCDDTVGEAAATRQTGTKVFIRARPPVVAPIAGSLVASAGSGGAIGGAGSGGAVGGAGTGAAHSNGDDALVKAIERMALVEGVDLASPTTKAGPHLLGGAAVVRSTLVWDWPHKSWHEAAEHFEDFVQFGGLRTPGNEAFAVNSTEAELMFREGRWNPLATHMRHDWSEFKDPAHPQAQKSIEVLFGKDFQRGLGGPRLPLGAMPEVPCRVAFPGNGDPGSVYEFKSSGDGRLWEQVLVYGLADVSRSSFPPPPADDVDAGASAAIDDWFWRQPPIAYCLCVTAPTAWISVVELAGRACVAPVSRPSWVGAKDIQQAWRNLPRQPAGHAPERLIIGGSSAEWKTARRGVAGATTVKRASGDHRASLPADAVQWTASPHVDADGASWFLKVFGWSFHSPGEVKSLVRTYTQLAAAVRDPVDACPKSLHAASLWFGYFCLLVRAPFLEGFREAPTAALLHGARKDVADAIAEALVWLLWHDLLYIDLRPQNVMLPPPSTASAGTPAAVLIDFDDAIHIPGLREELVAAGTVEAATVALRSRLGGMASSKDFTSRGLFPAVADAVARQLVKRGLTVAGASAAVPAAGAVAPAPAGSTV